jgi:type II secretory pathway component PulK
MPTTCTTPRLQLEQWWAEPHRKGSLGGQSVSTASTDLAAEFGFIGQDIAQSCSQEPHQGGFLVLSALLVVASST